jgi:hypothetical protein
MTPEGVVIVTERIPVDVLAWVARESFGDMVKLVVDVERRVIAVGGKERIRSLVHALLGEGEGLP